MIRMFAHLPAWGSPDMSPFTAYTDAYMRMAGIRFTCEPQPQGDYTSTPKGKLPYIVDTDGTVVSDTQLIKLYLDKKFGDPLDGHLSKEQRATATLIHRMISESWYWHIIQTRYRRDEDFSIYDPLWVKYLSWLPEEQRAGPVREFRERILTEFWWSGLGRNTEEEVEAMARSLTDAFSDLIGDKPSSLDANLYGGLVHAMFTPFPSPIGQYCRSKPNLVAYTDRIFDKYYPELRQDREETAAVLREEIRKRKPRDADSDHTLEEMFKGRPKR